MALQLWSWWKGTWLLRGRVPWQPSPLGCCWLQPQQLGCWLEPQAAESEHESHPSSAHASQPAKVAKVEGIIIRHVAIMQLMAADAYLAMLGDTAS